MLQPVDKRLQVSSFLVLYLVTSVQIGVGVLGFQPFLLEAKSDAWIAILVAAVLIHTVIWIIYKLVENSKGDLIDIHVQAFGKWIGNFFSVVIMLYFISTSLTVLRTYLEVVQVGIFPELTTWSMTIIFLMLVYYIVMGGFRTVTGICFLSLIIPSYLLLTFLFPLQFARWENLLPLFETGIKPIFSSAINMTLSYLGFTTLLVYIPFIENGVKSQKWAHLGTMFTTFVYIFIEIISIVFYSHEQLMEKNWATKDLWKVVEMPFVERFEYVGIASWFIVIIPNITLMIWAASRIGKRVFAVKQKYFLVLSLMAVFVLSLLFESREEIDQLNSIMGLIGKYYIFGYIPMLFLIHTILLKVRRDN